MTTIMTIQVALTGIQTADLWIAGPKKKKF
jgi:hypothetical protein